LGVALAAGAAEARPAGAAVEGFAFPVGGAGVLDAGADAAGSCATGRGADEEPPMCEYHSHAMTAQSRTRAPMSAAKPPEIFMAVL
jgi:hypothetical protein